MKLRKRITKNVFLFEFKELIKSFLFHPQARTKKKSPFEFNFFFPLLTIMKIPWFIRTLSANNRGFVCLNFYECLFCF